MISLETQFRSVGYAVLDQVIPSGALEALLKRCRDLPNLVEVRSGELRAELIHDHVDLREFLNSCPSLQEHLKEIVGPNLVLITNRHNHFGVSSDPAYRSARMHRDALGWTRSYITVLVPLGGFDSEAAQLELIPGSQLWPIAGKPNGGGYWIDEGPYSDARPHALRTNLKSGDVLVISPLVFHSAGWGSHANPREMLSLAIHGGDELLPSIGVNDLLLAGNGPLYAGQAWLREGE